MLSQPDAEFASSQPAIPGLDLILDTESVADALRANLPEADASNMRQVYTRYRPPTDCLVAYELQLGGSPTLIYAKAYCAKAYDKLRKTRGTTVDDIVGSGGLIRFAGRRSAGTSPLPAFVLEMQQNFFLTMKSSIRLPISLTFVSDRSFWPQ